MTEDRKWLIYVTLFWIAGFIVGYNWEGWI